MPTLGALHRPAPHWLWLVCHSCLKFTAVPLAPFVIRWGVDCPAERLKQAARCTRCGAKGAGLQVPSWRDRQRGWQAFPG